MKWVSSSRDEWVGAACAAAAGLLWAAVFPPLEWTWAAWAALAPLWIMARRAASDRQALRLGGAAGFLHWLLAIRWLTHVTVGGWIMLAAWDITDTTGSTVGLRIFASPTAAGGSWGFQGGGDGSIVINGTTQLAAPVPEPATMSLLGLGALAMVLRRKIRK